MENATIEDTGSFCIKMRFNISSNKCAFHFLNLQLLNVYDV